MIKDIEKRLAEYRATKKLNKATILEQPVEHSPEHTSQQEGRKEAKQPEKEELIPKPTKKKEKPKSKETLELKQKPQTSLEKFWKKYKRELEICVGLLKFFLWISLMTLSVEVEFGAVFFICTIFYLIFRNFRTGPKQQGELSAYSVFNPNCEAIDGTLTAEQFERELIGGPKSLQ